MSRAGDGVMGLLAISCLSVFACSQTAEELVNKNIEAKGGIDRIRSAKTLLATGKVKSGRGRVAVLRQMHMRPDSVGWQIQPFRGRKEPELMVEDNLRDLLLAADFDGPLVDYAEKGNTIEYLGARRRGWR